VALGVVLAILVGFTARNLLTMRDNIDSPPEFDFQFFWIFGRVLQAGLNPYEQANLLPVAAQLGSSAEFVRELYCFHLPPTLFLFAPLGWFDIHTASLVWYVVNSAILLLDIVLLWKMFMQPSSGALLLVSAAMVMTFFPVRSNIVIGQLDFLQLLTLLLFWRDRQRPRAGLWLALGMFVKPIMAILLLYVILRQRWRVLAAFIGSVIVLSALTILVFGSTTFWSFFSLNPLSNMPASLYTEMVNQSLLAVILRVTQADIAQASPIMNPVFLATAFILTAITMWITYQLSDHHDEWALALVLSLSLLVYPKALWHYSSMLLVPLFLVWRDRHMIPGGVWTAAAFIGAIYLLVFVAKGEMSFLANMTAWIFFAGVCAGWLTQRSSPRIAVSTASDAA